MSRFLRITVSRAALGAIASVAGAQPLPGAHPSYLHALSDLRAARWFLFHQPGDKKVYSGDDVGISEIDAAIGELKRVSIDDGKALNDHPQVDVHEHGSRLLKAIETLKKAHADADQEEDDPMARGLKGRVLEHIDRAGHAAQKAHEQWLKDQR